ncbi:Ankyrin repeat-containing protein [Marinospirillum celere]|uniref:Ankyrin repeat-containing protein n=1 Tax=Marinospirillum celere TaxID=1122252 RepID=A0A1I1FUG7_9GAMM|nr:response regulator [Marinospirillum celere]SFC00630.1 Ankyrin repeat-containing protein [Marinospirillum celere]
MTKTLMLVEDEASLLDNLEEMLELEGFDIIKAMNGGEALAQLKTHQPDLIVCDIMMPMMDGFEFLEKVRAQPETASLPFIFLTAKTSEEDQRLGRELGADDYLTKPFTREGLLKAIGLRLGKQHSLSHLERERSHQSGSRRSQAVLMRIAAVEGDVKTLEDLIQEGGNIDLLDEQGNSALMFAVMMRNEEAARILLNAGADPKLKHPKTSLSVQEMARTMGLNRLAREMG